MAVIYTAQHFTDVLLNTERYFALEYHAGTREMIHRYVCRKMGYVPPKMISASLRILRDRSSVVWEKHVWWNA